MLVIPTQPLPNQNLQVQIGDMACSLDIYQNAFALFIDVYVNGALVIGGVIAENLNRIVRNAYLGFTGDLVFFDTQGGADPVYTGLGERYQLIYLSDTEIAEQGL